MKIFLVCVLALTVNASVEIGQSENKNDEKGTSASDSTDKVYADQEFGGSTENFQYDRTDGTENEKKSSYSSIVVTTANVDGKQALRSTNEGHKSIGQNSAANTQSSVGVSYGNGGTAFSFLGRNVHEAIENAVSQTKLPGLGASQTLVHTNTIPHSLPKQPSQPTASNINKYYPVTVHSPPAHPGILIQPAPVPVSHSFPQLQSYPQPVPQAVSVPQTVHQTFPVSVPQHLPVPVHHPVQFQLFQSAHLPVSIPQTAHLPVSQNLPVTIPLTKHNSAPRANSQPARLQQNLQVNNFQATQSSHLPVTQTARLPIPQTAHLLFQTLPYSANFPVQQSPHTAAHQPSHVSVPQPTNLHIPQITHFQLPQAQSYSLPQTVNVPVVPVPVAQTPHLHLASYFPSSQVPHFLHTQQPSNVAMPHHSFISAGKGGNFQSTVGSSGGAGQGTNSGTGASLTPKSVPQTQNSVYGLKSSASEHNAEYNSRFTQPEQETGYITAQGIRKLDSGHNVGSIERSYDVGSVPNNNLVYSSDYSFGSPYEGHNSHLVHNSKHN